MAKARYEKPASQLDLEARQKKDYVPHGVLPVGQDPQPSESGFVGVDEVYQNFANDTDKPLLSDGGPEAKVEQLAYAENVDTSIGATIDGDYGDEYYEEEKTSGSTKTPETPSTPQKS